jgi:hypothetical protein
MWGRKRPSIFDILESFTRGSPFGREESFEEDWFREPFEEMIRRFEEEIEEAPEEYRAGHRRRGRLRASCRIWPLLSTASPVLQSQARSPYFRSSEI